MKKHNTLIMLFVILLLGCKKEAPVVLETIVPQVKTFVVAEEAVTPEIESFGSISFIRKTDITAAVDGIIKTIKHAEGASVREGEVLAELTNIQLEIQKKQALSSVAQAKAAYELAGTRYLEGRLSVEIKLLSIEKLELEIVQKKTELDELSATLQNKEELFAVGGITIEAIRNMRLSALSAQSAYNAQLKDLEISMIGLRDKDIIERGYQVPGDKEARINLLKKINTETLAAEVSVADAQQVSAHNQLTAVEELIKELRLVSPMNGILGTKYLEEGERITQGTKLLTILDTSQVYAVFNVQEDEVLLLSAGMEVEVAIDALGGKSLKGSIDLISPLIDPQTGNVTIKALLGNRDRGLKPGMFARVRVIYAAPRKQVRIPVTAIIRKTGNKGRVLTVVNSTLFQKEILLGREDEGRIEVLRGLAQNDVVVDSPSPLLKEGEKVNAET